jgi:CRP-like cAMP-binding protein
MTIIEEVASVPLFSSLSDDQLKEAAGWFHVQKNVGAGMKLVGEGAPGYTFFVILDGAAVVTKDGQQLATLGRGDYFGEMAILGEGRRTATVTSTEPVRLLVMFGTEFRCLEAAHPEIAARIMDAMKARLAGRVPDPA